MRPASAILLWLVCPQDLLAGKSAIILQRDILFGGRTATELMVRAGGLLSKRSAFLAGTK
jgi:hypothetical protein